MIPSAISPIVPPVAPKFQPKIYWIWTTGGPDTPHFPIQGKERAVEESSWESKALEPFLDSIVDAKMSRIIFDPHFDERVGIRSVWEYLKLNPKVETKIIVGKRDVFTELSSWKLSQDNSLAKYVQIKYSDLDFHDRFAVIDFELWHFGSTVGGAYPKFGAVTRGWSGEEFREVFETIWRKL
ncbi:MAG: hypothetical protein VST70_10265 [Nitrospirota bacterium]|nr:hypothetical protein [Nitrospirota bacterium]